MEDLCGDLCGGFYQEGFVFLDSWTATGQIWLGILLQTLFSTGRFHEDLHRSPHRSPHRSLGIPKNFRFFSGIFRILGQILGFLVKIT